MVSTSLRDVFTHLSIDSRRSSFCPHLPSTYTKLNNRTNTKSWRSWTTFVAARTSLSPCKRTQHCWPATSNVGSCWPTMLSTFSRSLKSDRFQTLPTSPNNMQQGVQKQVTCIQTMLGVLDQQCCVCLHGALVYLSSLKDFKNLFGLKKIVSTSINATRSCEIAT